MAGKARIMQPGATGAEARMKLPTGTGQKGGPKGISVHSTFSAVLFFNISMLAVYLLRRKNGFLAAYTAPVLRFLTLLGAVRLFLPLDVEKAWVIALPELLPFLHERLHIPLVPGVLSLGGALAGAGLALNGIGCRQKKPCMDFFTNGACGKSSFDFARTLFFTVCGR